VEKPRQKHLGQKNNSIHSYLFALDFSASSGEALAKTAGAEK
jgi:hypothetical protein